MLAAAAHAALAQDAPDNRLSASVTASANHVDTQRDNGGSERGLIFQLRPGVMWNSRSGRLRGNLSYFADLQHDTASGRNDVAHALDAALTAEAIENWFFVDVKASASRRALTAFGAQADPSSPSRGDDSNQEDVASLTLRPYVRGIFAGAVSYNVGVYTTASRTRNSALGDVDERGADFALGSVPGGLLGWGLNGSHQRTEFLSGRATVDQRVIASLNLRPDVDWLFTARGGQESTNVISLNKRRYNNWGGGIRWTPSPRTVLSADVDERYFGRSWAVALEHRMALSTFRLTSTRGASTTTNTGVYGAGITAYQLLFAQLAEVQPDPVFRDLLVLQTLRDLKIHPDARVPGGSLSNAVSLQRRTDLSWSYSAARLTLSLQAFSGDTETLDTLITPQLSEGPVKQRGVNVSAGWRLSPTAAANVHFSHLQTADNAQRPGHDLNSLAFGVSDQIGLRTTASVNARLSRQSGSDSYRETAIGAALSHRF